MQKKQIYLILVATINGLTLSKKNPKIFWCEYGKDFAHWLFPDFEVRQLILHKKYNKCDILVGGWGCSQSFAGPVVYVDGERGNGRIMQVQPKDLYLGPLGNFKAPNLMWVPVPAVRSLLSNLKLENAGVNFKEMEKPNFMAYMQSNCVPHRENAFNRFVHETIIRNVSRPHALGRCYGHFKNLKVGKIVRWNHHVNRDIYKSYKFVLAMENANFGGYVTEKIVNAFMGGAIPIYYGTLDIFKLFNKDAFVYYDVQNPLPAIEQVFHLYSNETAYKNMLNIPILASGAKKYFSVKSGVGDGYLYYKIRKELAKKLNNECNTTLLKN